MRLRIAAPFLCALLLSECTKRAPVAATASSVPRAAPTCDETLWTHVYKGIFPTAKDRLHVEQACITITGTIQDARVEKDGDFHVTVDVDAAFKNLLNDKNVSEQKGFLVVEPVCENKVTQADTLREGVCKSFHQTVYKSALKGKHVEITGAYVTDMEHGWREIHPVTSIVAK